MNCYECDSMRPSTNFPRCRTNVHAFNIRTMLFSMLHSMSIVPNLERQSARSCCGAGALDSCKRLNDLFIEQQSWASSIRTGTSARTQDRNAVSARLGIEAVFVVVVVFVAVGRTLRCESDKLFNAHNSKLKTDRCE